MWFKWSEKGASEEGEESGRKEEEEEEEDGDGDDNGRLKLSRADLKSSPARLSKCRMTTTTTTMMMMRPLLAVPPTTLQ